MSVTYQYEFIFFALIFMGATTAGYKLFDKFPKSIFFNSITRSKASEIIVVMVKNVSNQNTKVCLILVSCLF